MSCIPVDINRAMIDAGCKERVTGGKMIEAGESFPDAGSQPSLTANSSMSIAPSQNVGTAWPTIGNDRTILSRMPDPREAEITPTRMPNTREINREIGRAHV